MLFRQQTSELWTNMPMVSFHLTAEVATVAGKIDTAGSGSIRSQ